MNFKTPEYSQFLDIENEEWKNKSCGILSLKMLIDYWSGQNDVDPKDIENLIDEGLTIDAYIPDVGWRHDGLVEIAKNHGLDGESFDWMDEHPDIAFNKIIPHLSEHPVIASIYKDLVNGDSGHLVVLTGYEDGKVLYNDPNAKSRGDINKNAPLQKFLDGWKRRVVVIHPSDCKCNL